MKAIISFFKKALFLNQTDNLSLFFILKRWNIRFGPYFYKKKYSTSEIIDTLRGMGIGEGSNVFIHSSWDSFYNYTGDEYELIDGIIKLIGPNGTIAMPAFPLKRKNKLFDVRKSVTAAGLLNEAFRKYPNVKRSANERHSVCALGPLSEYLVKDHHNSLVAFDEQSPYYRICEQHFKVINLGLPVYFIGTFVHVSKTILRHEVPYFSQFYDENTFNIVHYIDYDGVERSYKEIYEPAILWRKSYLWDRFIIRKFVDRSSYQYQSISNLNVTCVDAYSVHVKLIELAKKNIFLYNYPIIKKKQRL